MSRGATILTRANGLKTIPPEAAASQPGVPMSGRPQPYDPLVPTPVRRPGARAGGLVAALVSVAAHSALLLALLAVRVQPPMAPEPDPITVALYEPPPPPPPEPPKTAPEPAGDPAPAKVSPPKLPVRPPRLVPPPEVEPLPAKPAPAPSVVAELGEADLMGAATAGSGSGAGGGGTGSGGGGCDMVRLLQDALRKNPRVRAALAQAHPHAVANGKAVLVWNGDWVQSPGQEGKGLAGVRELIMLEVAFAPKACREDPMRGLVLISLADGPGGPRLALGSRRWNWSDLLFAKSGRSRG